MPTIVIYEIDADPLGTADVTVLAEYMINITDDDAFLEGSDGSGTQLDINSITGFVGESTNSQVFETYSGTLSGALVGFTLLQYSTPTLIIATQGTFDVGDKIVGTGSSIVTAPSSTYSTLPDSVCFAAGSMVETPRGARPIEELMPGDLVLTGDGYAKPIKWVGRRQLSAQDLTQNPHLRPVVIEPDAIAPGIPKRAVRVSPQHWIVLSAGPSGIALGASALLAPAQYLTARSGIHVDTDAKGVENIHFLLDTHDVVNVAGLWSETLFLDDTTLGAVSAEARREIWQIFPHLGRRPHAVGPTCLPVVTKHEARVALEDFCAYAPGDCAADLSRASQSQDLPDRLN